MRKITFLVASFLVMLNATYAQDARTETDRRGNGNGHGYYGNGHGYGHNNGYYNSYAIDYRDAEPIVFKERNVEFFVFPNGEFDFNTAANSYIPRRGGINTTYGAPNRIEDRGPRGIRIEHDAYGRVRRIGNVFINYDYYGRVKRIGSVYMTYNGFALTRIGGMRIFYNYHGEIVGVSGYVNGYNYGYTYNPCPSGYTGGGHGYDDDYGYDDEDDFYYYKKDGTKEKMKTEDIEAIKRDKAERKK
ncbi:hypothetical protein [Flavobacterium urocaniciphilum]|uniref:Uncharacterized protein n=1 Tax=Flavobacterium urocaniciphilum TaxID=1299341 RepID=A0A1H9CZ51_9FLAO|nr:hypothetical protein [Flavobacterium urocaniciphilum]SEQ06490.1 hypothetical protein SAMN05444005_105172 [Flavobacterium urocaniciphilum]